MVNSRDARCCWRSLQEARGDDALSHRNVTRRVKPFLHSQHATEDNQADGRQPFPGQARVARNVAAGSGQASEGAPVNYGI